MLKNNPKLGCFLFCFYLFFTYMGVVDDYNSW